jgi:hypothetical protein
MGLVALVRLASKRTSQKTRNNYISIEKMWQKVRNQLKQNKAKKIIDFSPVQNAEPNMRGHFLKMVWSSTWRYGNRERKRVYSWLEGTVGPLNALLNYAGARLRDLAMTRYPFPEPEPFQIREYPDGSKKIISKEEAEHLGFDDATKAYWRAGYREKGKSPLILFAHPTLPEMDFVDMIRAHMVELCRQCFIHNVPRGEAQRYIRLLLHRLRPFLDWVYTDGAQGRPYFNRYSDHELREIVYEIRSLYGRRAGIEKSVTKGLDVPEYSFLSIEAFKKKVKDLRDTTNNEEEAKVYSNVLDHIDEGRIEQRDVEKLIDQVLALSSREGTEWHRILLSDLHHPKSLRQVVFAGDTMLDEHSSALIVGELPVSKKKGQIDLVIFLRRETSGQTIWTPVMLLEIKTKTSFDYNLYGLRTGNQSEEDYAPSLYAWKHMASDEEWNEIFSSSPSPRTLTQLKEYESELLQEYGEVAPFDTAPPKSLWKGVVVLDTDQSPLEVFEAFHTLLDDLVMKITSGLLDIEKTTSYSLGSTASSKMPRIAAILTPGDGPIELLKETCTPDSLPIDDPFSERVSDDRYLTLYVPVPSPTSAGNAAAWISRNWHLLNHIHECTVILKNTETYWIDLIGDFSGETLVKKRFGLDLLLSEGWIDKKQYTILDGLLDKIRFIDLSTNIDQILTSKNHGLDSLVDNLRLSLQDKSRSERIIVIDGWSEFRNIVPSTRQHLLRSLENRLLENLPLSNTNIIWIDSGVEHTRMNKHYQRPSVSPLSHDSPRRMHLDEIIYNIPTSTRSFGRFLPKNDDERFIVQDVPADAPPWRIMIRVPQLVDYSKKFRGGQRRKPTLTQEEVYGKEFRPMYSRGVTLSSINSDTRRYSQRRVSELEGLALSLVPSILRPRGAQAESQGQKPEPDHHPRQIITHTVATGKTSTLFGRLNFNPDAPPPKPHRAKREYVPADDITRRWYYERVPSHLFGDDDEAHVVMRPPIVRTTIASNIDTKRTRRRELKRLLNTARFLKRKKALSKGLLSCCEKIANICAECLSGEYDERILLHTLELIRDTILEDAERARIWETVRPIRQGLFNLLNSGNRSVLEEVFERSPDVLLLYGNNLFLTVLAVMDCVYNEILHHHVVPLWQSVVEWELYQLGFKVQKGIANSKYDIHSIYSNLVARARILPTLNLPDRILSTQQSGQIVWTGEMGKYSAWIVFQTEKGVVAGLVDDLHSQWLRPSWYRCTSDPQALKNKARQALYSTERNTIVVSEVRSHKIIWMLSDGEDGTVWFSSVLEYGNPQKTGSLVPWIRLTEIYEVPSPYDEVFEPPIPPVDVERYVDDFLRETISTEQDVTHVTCEVSINAEKRAYELQFKDRLRESTQDTLFLNDTESLVRILRHPIRKGVPLKTKNGLHLMWDHRKDIQYSDCEIIRGNTREIISTTFLKPLVHRSAFHFGEFLFPKTCDELLSTTAGDKVTLSIQSEGSRFYVALRGASPQSSLRHLESLELNIFDLGLLTECTQLVDTKKKTRHDVEIDARDLFGFSFSQLSDYPRLQEAIAYLDETCYDWSKEQWSIEVTESQQDPDIVLWVIKSLESGTIWMDRTFRFQLDFKHGLEQHINLFKEEVSQTVPVSRFRRFSETLQGLEKILRHLGLGEGKPRCRLDLELRGGERVAIVSRIEPESGPNEIDTFPVEMGNFEHLTELMTTDGGPLSYYDVVNLEEFYENVRIVLSEKRTKEKLVDGDIESDEEAELLRVIREYREEQDQKGLGHALVSLAQRRLSQGKTSDALFAAEEALTLLRTCDLQNRLVRSDLSIGLTAKAEALLREDREIEIVKKLLHEAKDIVQSLIDIIRPGRTDIIARETSERIDRLLRLVDEANTT